MSLQAESGRETRGTYYEHRIALALARRFGGSSSGTTFSFVYRPGGVAGANVYTTWPTLVAAVNAVAGLRLVSVDDSIADAHATAGAWNLAGWILTGSFKRTPRTGNSPTLYFDDATTLVAGGYPTLCTLGITLQSNSAAFVYTMGDGDILFFDDGAKVQNPNGDAPFFDTPAGVQAGFILGIGGQLGDGSNPVWEIDAPGAGFLLMVGYSAQVQSNALTGTGGVAAQIALGAIFNTTQPGLSGPQGLTTNVALEQSGTPASSGIAAVPAYSFLQETTLGLYRASPGIVGLAGGYTVTTAGAAPQTVTTAYTTAAACTARVVGSWNVQDSTAETTYGGESSANLRNFAGTFAVAGNVQGDTSGDASLAGATVAFSVVGGVLAITFTPPAAYPDALFWTVYLQVVENEGP